MADDSFLQDASIQVQDQAVLKNISQLGERLKQLRVRMLETEATAAQAKKEYEHYANTVIPQQMFAAGVDCVGLSSGGMLHVKRNFYCQPNKNPEDRAKIVEWLRDNGGDYLVKHDATVSPDNMDMLANAGIPFVENTSVNTTSLKAFIKDKLGVTTGVQQIQPDTIPACIHFQEVTTVELEV